MIQLVSSGLPASGEAASAIMILRLIGTVASYFNRS